MKKKYVSNEHRIIEEISEKWLTSGYGIIKGIGDDCAVIEKSGNQRYVVTTDALVENIHFLTRISTYKEIGQKAINVSISDISAMGAIPRFLFITIAIPKKMEYSNILELSEGFRISSNRYNVIIAGGDTVRCKNNIFISITAIGTADKDRIIYRNGANSGDIIAVTGSLGKSHAGLRLIQSGERNRKLEKFYHIPIPRVREGNILAKYGVSSMIDISDGLISEIKHICYSSGKGAVINTENIPISTEAKIVAKKLKENSLDYALYGGEDYELLFTAPVNVFNKIKNILPVTKIGYITEETEEVISHRGICFNTGYDHFTDI